MTEYSLHSEIKTWYSISKDDREIKVKDGFIIDVIRDNLFIEIQTKNFSAIKKKLNKLIKDKQVRLVYPIAKSKWITYVSKVGKVLSRRKSPKKGKLVDLFYELVHLSYLVKHSNFSFEVLLIEEEELRCNDGSGSWRRRGVSIKDRKLLTVSDRVIFEDSQGFLRFLPFDIGESFTNKLLMKKLGVTISLAQKITYCLRKMDLISIIGKKRKELVFEVNNKITD